MEEIELKYGDELFAKSRYYLSKVTVVRFTPTTIVLSDNNKIRKPFTNNRSYGIGTNTYYSLPNDELNNQFNRNLNDRYVSDFKFSKLNNQQLETVVALLKSMKTNP